MFNTISGLLLLLAPFLLIFCFKNHWRGFLYILSLATIWHLCLALVSQVLHIFNYQLIISLNLIVAVISVLILIKKTNKDSFKFKINFFTLIAFLIIFFELWSVHYFYTGPVSTITGQEEKTRVSNPYPYFSDEWVGAAIVNHAIENKTLPSGNPLVEAKKYNQFSNILVGFFSLVAEITLLLNLSPLFAYPLLAIGSGILISFLVYTILKINGLGNVPSTLGALCIPLIINSSNLPGLWYFLPFTGGLIMFLVGLGALELKDSRLFLIASLIASILYPPMTVFTLASFIGFLFNKNKFKENLKLSLFFILGIVLIGAIIINFQTINLIPLLEIIKSNIFYSSLDLGIASYPIYIIIPFIILPFSFFGLYLILKKKLFVLLLPIIVGSIFWTVYSQTMNYFIVSYERAVVTCSLLLIISAAFSWDYLFTKLKIQNNGLSTQKFNLGLKFLIIIIFSFIAWGYTENSNWQKLTLNVKTEEEEQSFTPNPPASDYLTEEDLEIFEDIKEKRILSIPWKALVVGVATHNYPLETKPSFISNNFLSYYKFINEDCDQKNNLAKMFKLVYVYSPAFNCRKFVEVNKSSEGLHLYKFNP